VRLSVGLEDVQDLIEDLDRALVEAAEQLSVNAVVEKRPSITDRIGQAVPA